ncbi:MAG: type I phosphomannose isomerase catalytic subunit [Balneolaceae bacterium]
MKSIDLYPLKFNPIIKDKIWGGTKLEKLLNKPTNKSKIAGESWEISGVPNNVSTVSEGSLVGRSLVDLIDEYKGALVGNQVYAKFGNKFPLLIKFIDANDDLSIQVHPDDVLAHERHNSFGKTEMWYVVDANEGSTLITGFNRKTNKDEYVRIFEEGRIAEILNKEVAEVDDVFFLPAGRVHTIGKGLLIAEIQQTSDVTYRIYDFDRVDADGNSRELHVEEALDAIDFTFYEQYKTDYNKDASESELVSCQYFATNRLLVTGNTKRDYTSFDSCVILMCLEGSGEIVYNNKTISYKLGDSILIPNAISSIEINSTSNSKILEVTISN